MHKFTGKVPTTSRLSSLPDIDKNRVFNNGIWQFDEEMNSNKYKGFIYLIHDPFMSRFYLGKKNFRSTRGQNKGREMDWRTYKSSSKSIKAMLEERSLSDFEFYCIEQYTTLGGLSHAETWSLCVVEALTTDDWYNRLINKVSWVVNEKVTNDHKKRLGELIGREIIGAI